MKVDPKDYDTKFKALYLIPGVGQLQFNQLYKFLIMIAIFLASVFILIGDTQIDKLDEFMIGILVVLEIINIVNYKKSSEILIKEFVRIILESRLLTLN